MFKVEVTYGSDPIAQAALTRRVHDPVDRGGEVASTSS
jgi:hypothetical protein